VGRARWPALLIAVALMGVFGWQAWSRFKPAALPPGLAWGNGRIEATEVDVATRSGGRVLAVLVREGDDVQAGQVVAQMDTATLAANLARAHALLQQTQDSQRALEAQVRMRAQGVTTAQAQVAQREAELNFAQREWRRSKELVDRGFLSPAKLDQDQVQVKRAHAALAVAQSQVAEAQAAVAAAQAQRIEGLSAIEAARANVGSIEADLADGTLRAPRSGRVQVRAAEAGEVLAPGGKILSLADLGDVYMTFFLPEAAAGRLPMGAEVRIVLDAAPRYYVPARVSYVSSTAQFTPKTVETASERQKMMFRIRASIDKALLARYRNQVKTGLPGVAYVMTQSGVAWPTNLSQPLPMSARQDTPPAASGASAR
jgi:HlyD family secretion protein